MKKFILTAVIAATTILGAAAQDASLSNVGGKSWEFRPYYSTNFGVTTSFGVPQECREINGSDFKWNYVFGCDVMYMISDRWGINSGLRYERKASNSNVYMENFYSTVTMGEGEGTPTHGYYTGNTSSTFDNRYLTLPVMALYRASKKWDIRFGAYFSYNVRPSYLATAYDGKIRENPLVPAVGVDNSTTDFSKDVNKFDMGIQAGAIWTIWKNLNVNFDINWGLINVLDSPDSGMTMNVYNLYFNCGIGWRF